jgi:hypothetical protein
LLSKYESPTINNSNYEDFDDRVGAIADKAFREVGSAMLLSMQAANLVAYGAQRLAEVQKQTVKSGLKFTGEAAIAGAMWSADRAKDYLAKKSEEPVEIDGIEVLPDQQHGLEMLANEDRASAQNTVAGSTVFSIDRQLREEGKQDVPESSRERFIKLAEVEAGLSSQQARHLADLPDPRRILDN